MLITISDYNNLTSVDTNVDASAAKSPVTSATTGISNRVAIKTSTCAPARAVAQRS